MARNISLCEVENDNEPQLTCSVCLEQFKEPKVLPCCHIFCLCCLDKTASSVEEGKIKCPQCRQVHDIPLGGVQEFLTDFVTAHEAEVRDVNSPKHPIQKKDPMCGECEGEGPVVSYCGDCQCYLCGECATQAHKKYKSYRMHKVVSVGDLDATTLQASKVHYCKEHRGEVLKLFCEDCKTLICRDCTLVDHNNHNYKFVQDVTQRFRDQLTSSIKEGIQQLATFEANLREVQNVERSVASYPETLRAQVNSFCDDMVQSIETRRKELLAQVETECQKDLKVIWADKSFHETSISSITAALKLSDKALKCTHDVEMIQTAQQCITQLTQLDKVQWNTEQFVEVVSSPATIRQGRQLQVNEAGDIGRGSKATFLRWNTKPLNFIEVVSSPATIRYGRQPQVKAAGDICRGSKGISVKKGQFYPPTAKFSKFSSSICEEESLSFIIVPGTHNLVDARNGAPVNVHVSIGVEFSMNNSRTKSSGQEYRWYSVPQTFIESNVRGLQVTIPRVTALTGLPTTQAFFQVYCNGVPCLVKRSQYY